MASFDTVIRTTELFYRSSDDPSNLQGYWYAFNPNDTFGYGKITGEFKSVRELKLIDITKQEFYDDFLSKIREASADTTFNSVKNHILFPIGFCNNDAYCRFAQLVGLKPYYPPNNLDLLLELQYFGNRSRCSIKELDIAFMEHLKVFYPSHDGVISRSKLPNLIYNGMHHAEIGVFDKNLLTMAQQIPRPHVGGQENLYGKPNMLIAVDHHHPSFDIVRNHAKAFAKWYKPLETNVPMTYKTRKNRKSRS